MFKSRWRYLFSFLLGIYSFLNIKFTQGDTLLSMPISDWALAAFALLIVFCLWEGNRLIEYLNGRITYKKVSSGLFRQFIASLILVGMATPLFNIGINLLLGSNAWFEGFNQLLGFSFRINLFLQCIHAITVYNQALSSTKLMAETLKKETFEAQFEALRNQVNPHFLFNSFNVLTSLIETNEKLAIDFVEQLSKVYRYLLRTQEMKTVPLSEELDFIESYLFLLRIRFGNSLRFDKKIRDEDSYIPPSTLQLLIENAIKHNEVSKQNPLLISLERSNGTLTLTNNKNPKQKVESSEKIGLANIQKRYQLLGANPPSIVSTDEEYSVQLALIKNDEDTYP